MNDFNSYRSQRKEAMALEEAGLFRGPASAIGWCPGSGSQASEETKAACHGTDRDAMRILAPLFQVVVLAAKYSFAHRSIGT